MMKRFLMALLLIAGVGAGLVYFFEIDARALLHEETRVANEKKSEKQDQNPPPAISVVNVSIADFVETVMVTGSLTARDEVLIHPEVEGLRVTNYLVDEGDEVTKGQVLATLESHTLKAQLDQSRASLDRAHAQIAQAKSQIAEAEASLTQTAASLKRAKPLRRSGHLSKSTYDDRVAAHATAKARLASAKDGLKLGHADFARLKAEQREIEWRLSKSDIKSPVSGVVARRNVKIGSLASSAMDPLFTIIADGEIELDAELDSIQLAKVKPGQKARVLVVGRDAIEGQVRLVSPEIDRATRLGRVRIFLGKNSELKVGAFARGMIETDRSRGLSVPASAVLYDDQAVYVLRVDNDRVRKTNIEVGLRTGDLVEVRKGLKASDTVVAKAGTFLRDGDVIRAFRPEAKLSEAN